MQPLLQLSNDYCNEVFELFLTFPCRLGSGLFNCVLGRLGSLGRPGARSGNRLLFCRRGFGSRRLGRSLSTWRPPWRQPWPPPQAFEQLLQAAWPEPSPLPSCVRALPGASASLLEPGQPWPVRAGTWDWRLARWAWLLSQALPRALAWIQPWAEGQAQFFQPLSAWAQPG